MQNARRQLRHTGSMTLLHLTGEVVGLDQSEAMFEFDAHVCQRSLSYEVGP
jgi:hypothetical protein